MGEDYVRGMCHDIEDPTFDATAVATNPHAQIRPIHRPPRVPANRHPHCAWTVIIDESYPPAAESPALQITRKTRAATTELDAIDTSQEGQADYSGPLLSDFDFGAYSHSALVRMADEVCLQMHLLYLSFALAVHDRAEADVAQDICTRQLIGIAGVAAERIHHALALPRGIDGAIRVFELHPLFNPAAYVHAKTTAGAVHVHRSPAHDDGAWISLCTPDEYRPLQAIAAAVDSHIDVKVTGTDTDWTAQLHRSESGATEFPEVSMTKVSTGATFQFQPRHSLPLTVV
jgi:hypothetical protein